MSYSDFTSLPPEEEQQFIVFERQSVESSSRAMMLGLISGGIFGAFVIILYLTSTAPKAMHTDALDDDMAEETPAKAREKAPRPDPAPAPSEGAATDDGAEGAADDGAEGDGAEGAAGAEGAEAPVVAPKPPPGATKAPPTALTN